MMGFIEWIIVGLIAGFLAGKVMKGGGYGVLVDIILGILGGILGGVALRDAGDMATPRGDRVDHCRLYWRGDSGLDHSSDQESVRAL